MSRLFCFCLMVFLSGPALAAPSVVPGSVVAGNSGVSAVSLVLPGVSVPAVEGASRLVVCVGTERGASTPASASTVLWNGRELTLVQAANFTAAGRTQRAGLYELRLANEEVVSDLSIALNTAAARVQAVAFVVQGSADLPAESSAPGGFQGAAVATAVDARSQRSLLIDCLNLGNGSDPLVAVGQTEVAEIRDSEAGTAVSFEPGPAQPVSASMGWTWAVGARAAHVVAVITGTTDYLPSDHGMVDVTLDPHCTGVVGDGVTDVTAPLQACVEWFAGHDSLGGVNVQSPDTLCFPDGTYLVSGPIVVQTPDLIERAYTTFRGCGSPGGFELRLAANSAPYQDPNFPTAVLRLGNPGNPNGLGAAAQNNLRNLRVAIGPGNPGAIGIDYIGNNGPAHVRDVQVIAEGPCVAGFSVRRKWPGPFMVKRLEVEGCSLGVELDYSYSSAMFEDVTVQGQSVAGVLIDRFTPTFLRLLSEQIDPNVPAVRVTNSIAGAGPFLTLIAGVFVGNGGSAVDLVKPTQFSYRPLALLREIVTQGYDVALNSNGTNVIGPNVDEYVTPTGTALDITFGEVFPSIHATIDLAIPDQPEGFHPYADEWANVAVFGAVPNDGLDDTAAFQAAIDSGAAVTYCPKGSFSVSDTLILRSTFERLVGFDCGLSAIGSTMRVPAFKPAFITDASLGQDALIEDLRLNRGDRTASPFPEPRMIHRSPFALAMTNVLHLTKVVAESGAGPLFYENGCCDEIHRPFGGEAILRAANVESAAAPNSGDPTGKPDVHVVGGTMLSLSFKSENNVGPYFSCEAGAICEALGSFHYHSGGTNASPVWECIESECVFGYSAQSGGKWSPQARVTREGTTLTMPQGYPGNTSRVTLCPLCGERP